MEKKGLSWDMYPNDQFSTGARNERVNYTIRVVTRWFRSPEIALGDLANYTEKLDVWSIGCTFAEIIARRTLFPSPSDEEHFPTILR